MVELPGDAQELPLRQQGVAPNGEGDEASALLAELRTDGPSSAVQQVEAAFERVRAEAVAGEQQRIAAAAVELATLTDQAVVRGGYREGEGERVETLWQQLGVVLPPDGSVPVATPPEGRIDERGKAHIIAAWLTDEAAEFDDDEASEIEVAICEHLQRRAAEMYALADGLGPVATPEPEDSRITNQSGHEFTFTVESRGEGMNWSHTMVPQTVQAWNLRDAIAEIAALPFASWFPDEGDEAATPGPDSVAELAKSCGECTEDGLGSCQHGCRERSSPVATPAKPGTCPQCRHAAHGPVCFNMASDNDCACSVATPTEPAPGSDEAYGRQQLLQAENRLVATLHGRSVPCCCPECAASPVPAVQPPTCQHGSATKHVYGSPDEDDYGLCPGPAEQPEER